MGEPSRGAVREGERKGGEGEHLFESNIRVKRLFFIDGAHQKV